MTVNPQYVCPRRWQAFVDLLNQAIAAEGRTYKPDLSDLEPGRIAWTADEFTHCPLCGTALDQSQPTLRDRHP